MSNNMNKISQSAILLEKELQNLAKEKHRFNIFLAKLFLGLPIPMNYELWCYLHKIADGDVE